MTEIQRTFYDDIREKKSIKNAASKTNRTGKGPVRFPSDYLSRKEKQAMNGECKSWKYSDFPDWQAFIQMPDDVKISYLNWILNVYNVGIGNISVTVFGRDRSLLHIWLKRNPEVAKYLNTPPHGFKSAQKDRERFENDVRVARASKLEIESETKTDSITPKIEKQESAPVDICEPAFAIPMRSIDFTMDGFDMEFLDTIRSRFGDSKIRVRIVVEACE